MATRERTVRVGWVLLLDYLLLPAINYLVIALYLHAQFPEIPSSALIFCAPVLVSGLNVVGIGSVRNVSLLLVVAQLIFAAVFTVAAVSHADGRFPLEPVYSSTVAWPSILAGSAVLCLSFLGFDAVSTLSEEAHAPERTVPSAILLTTLCGGLIFTILSYAAALVVPDWRTLKVSDSVSALHRTEVGGGRVVSMEPERYRHVPRPLTVASLQRASDWDLDGNIVRAEALVRRAAAQGAQIILLPALFETPRSPASDEKARVTVSTKLLRGTHD